MTTAPVLLFVFNRLETTCRVFERIAEAKPKTLLVVADGPRRDHSEDTARCNEVLDLVSHPDWDCDLRLEASPVNLGFKRRISSGLSWGFSQFESLIILEDDTLPDPSFFEFCTQLLERYRFEERVKMIAGSNFQFGRQRGDGSYYLSRGVGTWGWASWRRAFLEYDPAMRSWPSVRDRNLLERIWPTVEAVAYWRERFDEAYQGKVDAWDYQWAFSMWLHDGLQLACNKNLIQYIGCLRDTAHTTDPSAPFCNIPTSPIDFPLRHPAVLEPDTTADLFEFYRVFLYLDADEADSRSRR